MSKNMLQLNDRHHTLIDLSKKNLKGIKYVCSEPYNDSMDPDFYIENSNTITLKFVVGDVEIEETFTYAINQHTLADYKMLVDMIEQGPKLLLEENETYDYLEFQKRKFLKKKLDNVSRIE